MELRAHIIFASSSSDLELALCVTTYTSPTHPQSKFTQDFSDSAGANLILN